MSPLLFKEAQVVGHRRFWPIDCRGKEYATKDVLHLSDETVDQIWEEALSWYSLEGSGNLILPAHLDKEVEEIQEAHRDVDPRAGLILEFLDRKVPEDWSTWPLDRRRDFWAGSVQGLGAALPLVDRDRICAQEVWCELFGGNPRDSYKDYKYINSVISREAGWRYQAARFPAYYGSQPAKGFVRQDL